MENRMRLPQQALPLLAPLLLPRSPWAWAAGGLWCSCLGMAVASGTDPGEPVLRCTKTRVLSSHKTPECFLQV